MHSASRDRARRPPRSGCARGRAAGAEADRGSCADGVPRSSRARRRAAGAARRATARVCSSARARARRRATRRRRRRARRRRRRARPLAAAARPQRVVASRAPRRRFAPPTAPPREKPTTSRAPRRRRDPSLAARRRARYALLGERRRARASRARAALGSRRAAATLLIQALCAALRACRRRTPRRRRSHCNSAARARAWRSARRASAAHFLASADGAPRARHPPRRELAAAGVSDGRGAAQASARRREVALQPCTRPRPSSGCARRRRAATPPREGGRVRLSAAPRPPRPSSRAPRLGVPRECARRARRPRREAPSVAKERARHRVACAYWRRFTQRAGARATTARPPLLRSRLPAPRLRPTATPRGVPGARAPRRRRSSRRSLAARKFAPHHPRRAGAAHSARARSAREPLGTARDPPPSGARDRGGDTSSDVAVRADATLRVGAFRPGFVARVASGSVAATSAPRRDAFADGAARRLRPDPRPLDRRASAVRALRQGDFFVLSSAELAPRRRSQARARDRGRVATVEARSRYAAAPLVAAAAGSPPRRRLRRATRGARSSTSAAPPRRRSARRRRAPTAGRDGSRPCAPLPQPAASGRSTRRARLPPRRRRRTPPPPHARPRRLHLRLQGRVAALARPLKEFAPRATRAPLPPHACPSRDSPIRRPHPRPSALSGTSSSSAIASTANTSSASFVPSCALPAGDQGLAALSARCVVAARQRPRSSPRTTSSTT